MSPLQLLMNLDNSQLFVWWQGALQHLNRHNLSSLWLLWTLLSPDITWSVGHWKRRGWSHWLIPGPEAFRESVRRNALAKELKTSIPVGRAIDALDSRKSLFWLTIDVQWLVKVILVPLSREHRDENQQSNKGLPVPIQLMKRCENCAFE